MSNWLAYLHHEADYPDVFLMRPDGKLACNRQRLTVPAALSAVDYWINTSLSGEEMQGARAALSALVQAAETRMSGRGSLRSE